MLAVKPTAKDVMSRDPVVVRDDFTAAEVVELFRDHEISGAPVEDRQGRLVGVISLADIARAGSEDSTIAYDRSTPGYFLRDWEEEYNPEDLRRLHLEGAGPRVRDVMTPSLFTVGEDAPVADVARLMVTSHLHRVLVTREGEGPHGGVVGIISSLDLLELLAAED